MVQVSLDIPKQKKQIRITFMANESDKHALEIGMSKVGETNVSSYIRRLIHQNK